MLHHYPLIALLITQLMAVALPGADFFMIIRQSLKHGRLIGILTALGVTSGAAIYCSVTIFGLGWLKSNAQWLMSTIAILGSVYLIYMGWQCLFHSKKQTLDDPQTTSYVLKPQPTQAYLIGLATNLSNPKVVVYYISVLPLFLTLANSLSYKITMLLGLMAITLIWFITVAIIMSHNKIRRWTHNFMAAVEYIFGVVLWIFAGLLLWHFLLSK